MKDQLPQLAALVNSGIENPYLRIFVGAVSICIFRALRKITEGNRQDQTCIDDQQHPGFVEESSESGELARDFSEQGIEVYGLFEQNLAGKSV
jgi:hypothetical protein